MATSTAQTSTHPSLGIGVADAASADQSGYSPPVANLPAPGTHSVPIDFSPGSSPRLPCMHRPWQDILSDAEAARIATDIDRQGFGVLSLLISEQELEPVRAVIRAAVDAAHGEYVGFRGTDALAGTVLEELPKSASFQGFCRRLYELGTGQTAPEVEFYQILRCLQGRTGQTRSWYFHYDSYVVTALLPVAIPSEGRRGDLLIIPSTRQIRRLYLTNLLDKLLIENRFMQAILRSATRRRRLNTIAIPMQTGNIYFFWGYRSIHTNEACDLDKLRATALFHYGDPHRNSLLRGLIRGVQMRAES